MGLLYKGDVQVKFDLLRIGVLRMATISLIRTYSPPFLCIFNLFFVKYKTEAKEKNDTLYTRGERWFPAFRILKLIWMKMVVFFFLLFFRYSLTIMRSKLWLFPSKIEIVYERGEGKKYDSKFNH